MSLAINFIDWPLVSFDVEFITSLVVSEFIAILYLKISRGRRIKHGQLKSAAYSMSLKKLPVK